MNTNAKLLKPTEAYVAMMARVNLLISEVGDLVQDHQDSRSPTSVTWGAVGDLQEVASKLEEIKAFLARK